MAANIQSNESKRTVRVQLQLSGSVREETFGTDVFVIAPVVALVEGVIQSSNSSKPELALASEFGMFPAGWDGRPVLIDHPQQDGVPVSANSFEQWNENVIGQIFNTKIVDYKLVPEIWINKTKAEKVNGGQYVLDSLSNSTVMEVSTGLYALVDSETGLFDGSSYNGVWRQIVPDHLAILSQGSIGACSIEDGCGFPRANSKESNMPETVSATPCKCTQVPGDITAVNAANAANKATKPGLKSFMANLIRSAFNINAVSHEDKRSAISMALQETLERSCYVMAVFDDVVVYETYDEDYNYKLYQIGYTFAEGGAITLTGTSIEVRPETSFVPVVVGGGEDSEETIMTNEQTVEAGAQALDATEESAGVAASAPTGEDTTQVQEVSPSSDQVAAGTEVAPASTSTSGDEIQANSAAGSLIDIVANASPEDVAALKAHMARETYRADVIARISAAGEFTTEELTALPCKVLGELDKKMNVASVTAPKANADAIPAAPLIDFTGRGGAALRGNAASEEAPILEVFPSKKMG